MKALRLALALCLAWTAASAQVIRAPPRPGFKPGFQYINGTCTPFTYPVTPYYQDLTLTSFVALNSGAAITLNQVASPACTVSGATQKEDSTAAAVHENLVVAGGAVSAKAYTFTVFAQRHTGTRNIEIQMRASGGSFSLADVDLSNCTIHGTFAFGVWSAASGTGTLQSNGWCKATLTATTAADTFMPLYILMSDASFNTTYTGDGVSSVDLWGVDVR